MQVTHITSEKPTRITKHFEIVGEELVKKPGGAMRAGVCTVRDLPTINTFVDLLSGLKGDEALVYGVPKGCSAAKIVTRSVYDATPPEKRTGMIARTNDHFEWPAGPAVFMIDIDPEEGQVAPSMDEAISILHKICPEVRDIPAIWYPSSSSYIYRDDGTELHGLRGQHIYVPVDDGRDIPHLAEALWMRSWSMGLGYIKVGASGQKLKRSVFDNAVYQPSRLDFAAGASTGAGLYQNRGAPVVI
ncbi:MAG: hypothetical protein ACI9ND_001080 [Yoonia sp.]|jgi:hypothetical protein